MDEAQSTQQLIQFGFLELTAQISAKQVDPAFAAQLLELGKTLREKMNSGDEVPMNAIQINLIVRAAEEALQFENLVATHKDWNQWTFDRNCHARPIRAIH